VDLLKSKNSGGRTNFKKIEPAVFRQYENSPEKKLRSSRLVHLHQIPNIVINWDLNLRYLNKHCNSQKIGME
jgi:hypothetical protein